MPNELPSIHFAPESEVRLSAERRRAEAVKSLLKLFIDQWMTRFRRGRPAISNAAQYAPATQAVGTSTPVPDQRWAA
jgi:hypothetical protein